MTDTITTKQLAAILGISITRVNELGRKGKIPREADGGWNLVKVNAALRRNMDKHQALKSLGQVHQSDNTSPESVQSETFAEAQRRNEWLKVQKAEMELKVRSGELVETEKVSREWCSVTTMIQTRMMMVPDKAAPKITSSMSILERRAVIEREIREALTALSEYESNAA